MMDVVVQHHHHHYYFHHQMISVALSTHIKDMARWPTISAAMIVLKSMMVLQHQQQ